MDKETKDIVLEVDTLNKVKANLEGKIKELQIQQNSLEAQAHTAIVKGEQDDKLKDLERRNQYAQEERKIELKRIQAEKRIDLAETLEQKLNDRTKEVEKREQKTLEIEEKIANFNKQRANFELYKTGIEKDLSEAKEVIAQADEAFNKIAIENDMLKGREVKIMEQEKYWNDEIGKLEEEMKKFQIEKENLLGLGKIKEGANA